MEFQFIMYWYHLLVPTLMIICGFIMYKKPPKKINDIYGYRTDMSKKNNDTWQFAHNYCGKIWVKVGFVLFVFSFIFTYLIVRLDGNLKDMVSLAFCLFQIIVLIISTIPVERALKRNFDEAGKRK